LQHESRKISPEGKGGKERMGGKERRQNNNGRGNIFGEEKRRGTWRENRHLNEKKTK